MQTEIQIKERPIRLYQHEVQAVLQGRQTMLRRVFKYKGMGEHYEPIPHHVCKDGGGDWIAWSGGGDRLSPNFDWDKKTLELYPNGGGIKCPYGKPGDRLWVRETWARNPDFNPPYDFSTGQWLYRADFDGPVSWNWKPSIYMRRIASRILLEITDVRVERLQDISEDDAIAEGVESFRPVPGDGDPETLFANYMNKGRFSYRKAYFSFKTLWQSINGPESWEQNPWAWVITFEKI